jgi:hypothetical protein
VHDLTHLGDGLFCLSSRLAVAARLRSQIMSCYC